MKRGVYIFVFGCVVFLLPNTAHTAQLDVFQSISHGGATIIEGETIYRPDLTQENNSWVFQFTWPHQVPNADTTLVLFEGEYGALNGGGAVEGENYSLQLQKFAEGQNVISKTFSLPPLKNSSSYVGVYTLLLAERDGQSVNDVVDWFSSGGVSDFEPANYSTLSFTFEQYKECCSSVLFLPGIKGSELYHRDTNDKLWPPSLLSSEILELSFDEYGESINDIYVGDMIESVFGVGVYDDYADLMDELVGDGVISQWHALPYDWRYDLRDVVENGVEYRDETINIISLIEEMANISDTGKVSIIGHSNGGLLGKVIIDVLDKEGEEDLVDNFITVGTPHLGAPKAIPALLHGYDEKITFLVSAENARTFSQYIPGGYNLLPSKEYFSQVIDPPIIFDTENEDVDEWRDRWGVAISKFSELEEFLKGDGVSRDVPGSDDLYSPIILDSVIFNEALEFHEYYDDLEIPESIENTAIVGWGMETIKSVVYTERGLRPQFTVEGDKTVISESANDLDEVFYFNLFQFNKIEGEKNRHLNFMNAIPIQELIKNKIKNVNQEISYISNEKPSPEDVVDKLLVSTHSPVTLDISDRNGNHTGLVQNPGSDIYIIEEEIPGSALFVFGDEIYISLPQGGFYDVEIWGTGDGFLELDVESGSEDTFLSCPNIVVNEDLNVVFEIHPDNDIFIELDDNIDVYKQNLLDWNSVSSEDGNLSCELLEDIIYSTEDNVGEQAQIIEIEQESLGASLIGFSINIPENIHVGDLIVIEPKEIDSADRYVWEIDGVFNEGRRIITSFNQEGIHNIRLHVSKKNISTSIYKKIEVSSAQITISDFKEGEGGFIEITNNSNREVDIGLWQIMYEDGIYIFPEKTYIRAGASIMFSNSVTKIFENSELLLQNPIGENVYKYEI